MLLHVPVPPGVYVLPDSSSIALGCRADNSFRANECVVVTFTGLRGDARAQLERNAAGDDVGSESGCRNATMRDVVGLSDRRLGTPLPAQKGSNVRPRRRLEGSAPA